MQVAAQQGLLDAGASALRVGEWQRARCCFEAALEEGESAEGRLGLGTALWWLGEFGASLQERERAFVGFRGRGDHGQAAVVALWLSIAYQAGYANRAAARGWLGRAERVIEQSSSHPCGPGWCWSRPTTRPTPRRVPGWRGRR